MWEILGTIQGGILVLVLVGFIVALVFFIDGLNS